MTRTTNLRTLWAIVAVLGLAVAGCTTGGTAPPAGGVEIRIANRSGVDFDRVDVTFPDNEVSYGAVAKGAASEYRRVRQAYRYAMIVATAGGETYRFQPIDYVGETLLEPGRYTYALSTDPNDRVLSIELVED